MSIIQSALIGGVAGSRSMTPLAAVSIAAWRGTLPKDNGAPEILAHPLVAAGTVALAAGELLGDKLPSAPDRIVIAGLLARMATGAIAGAALAPRSQRTLAAAIGAASAVAASYPTFHARMRAMEDHGQTATGLVEDAAVIAAAAAIVAGAAPGTDGQAASLTS